MIAKTIDKAIKFVEDKYSNNKLTRPFVASETLIKPRFDKLSIEEIFSF